ncbi:hypothetical protein CSUI_001144, partial [Cystoisospora suis]
LPPLLKKEEASRLHHPFPRLPLSFSSSSFSPCSSTVSSSYLGDDTTTQSTVYLHSDGSSSSVSPSSHSTCLLQSHPSSPRLLQPDQHSLSSPCSPLRASSSSGSHPSLLLPSLADPCSSSPSIQPPRRASSSSRPSPSSRVLPPSPDLSSPSHSLSLPLVQISGARRQVSLHSEDAHSFASQLSKDETCRTTRTESSTSSLSSSSSPLHPHCDLGEEGGSLTSDPPSFLPSLTSDSSFSPSFVSSSLHSTVSGGLPETTPLSDEEEKPENNEEKDGE